MSMELAQSDSEIDAHYMEVFKSHLLPPLGHMMRRPELSVQERSKAIKFLADGSLALTGSGAEWSAALGNKVRRSAGLFNLGKSSNILSPSRSRRRASQLLQTRRIQTAKARFTRQFQLSSPPRSLIRSYFSPSRRAHLILRRRRRRRRAPQSLSLQRGTRSQQELTQHKLAEKQMLKSRVKALQGLVPGGNTMSSSVLLNETADYMMFLKLQVGVLQSLASAIETSQKAHLHAAASGA